MLNSKTTKYFSWVFSLKRFTFEIFFYAKYHLNQLLLGQLRYILFLFFAFHDESRWNSFEKKKFSARKSRNRYQVINGLIEGMSCINSSMGKASGLWKNAVFMHLKWMSKRLRCGFHFQHPFNAHRFKSGFFLAKRKICFWLNDLPFWWNIKFFCPGMAVFSSRRCREHCCAFRNHQNFVIFTFNTFIHPKGELILLYRRSLRANRFNSSIMCIRIDKKVEGAKQRQLIEKETRQKEKEKERDLKENIFIPRWCHQKAN